MKEKPILFSTEMVKAIIDGRKTMTRRVKGLEDVNKYPGINLKYMGLAENDYYIKDKKGFKKNQGIYHMFYGEQPDKREINLIPIKCPYGQIGDRLWVRETWSCCHWENLDGDGGWRHETLKYKADNTDGKWRPSIFMPRWASRITLEITDIRVEKLQDIIFQDIYAEGVRSPESELFPVINIEDKLKKLFQQLWDSINAKHGYSWDTNPFCWVIEFIKR